MTEDPIKNIPPFMRNLKNVHCVPYEEREHITIDPQTRRCRTCKQRKLPTEFEKMNSQVCKECKKITDARLATARSAALTARHARNRAEKEGEIETVF
jgi:hypothetical protein